MGARQGPNSAATGRAARESHRSCPSELRRQRPIHPDLDAEKLAALRRGRLAQLQATMRRREVAICLFFSPANIRYATGTDVMGVWSATTFERHWVVPAIGDPVLFEYPGPIHVSERLVRDVRPAREWQFKLPSAEAAARPWAREIRSVMTELGRGGESLGVDKLDAFGFLARDGIPRHRCPRLRGVSHRRLARLPVWRWLCRRRTARHLHARTRSRARDDRRGTSGRHLLGTSNVAPKLPERYLAQRYASLGHQAGLGVEGPDIPYPDDVESWTSALAAHTVRAGMVLSLQCYAGAVGGSTGVKLEVR